MRFPLDVHETRMSCSFQLERERPEIRRSNHLIITEDGISPMAETTATEPKQTGPDFTPGITLLAGFGAGIALMYYLDPEHGKARRNLLRDKVMSWSRKAAVTARGTAVDVSNRAQGAIHETSSQIKGQMMAPEADPTSETQTWRTSGGDGGEYANSSWPESLPEESVSN